ncbi:MAG: hypothetical protein ACHBN1_33230 [Heteroscytonema crispum UTEX LB 1556]
MLRRSLFVSALLLAGAFGFASSAKAVDQPVTFGATIDATCNLTTPATGSLAGSLIPNATKTVLSTTGGTPARIGVDCGTGKIKVSDPVLTSYPAGYTDTPTNTATITTLSGQTTGTTDLTLVPGDKGDAVVKMTSSNGDTEFPAGDYEYTVTVTATP